MNMENERIGIVLAGGLSGRYGKPKAFAELNGRKFYEIAYDTLRSVADDVIIVAREEHRNQFPATYRVIADQKRFAGCGPLAGIYSAMMEEKARSYAVLPCDMPLVTPEMMERLVRFHTKDVAVVVSEGHLQPLVSIWDKGMKERIRASLEKGRLKLTDAFEGADLVQVDGQLISSHPEAFMNVNTPEEDRELRKWKRL